MKFEIKQGHVLDVLRTMRSESVHCVVTSPPYWSLRDYGVPPVVWDPEVEPLITPCEHRWGVEQVVEGLSEPWQHAENGDGRVDPEHETEHVAVSRGAFCWLCGAWRGCLGLEPTLALYIQHIVAIFSEVRRVLRKDGTCWLNIGDCYNAYNGNRGTDSQYAGKRNEMEATFEGGRGLMDRTKKQKDLLMVPARVAIALCDDGWYLRNDIIWHKPNPMPESCTDRCTKSHEHMFLLSKRPEYYYDRHAIAEPISEKSLQRYRRAVDTGETYDRTKHKTPSTTDATKIKRAPMEVLTEAAARIVAKGTRNKRDVWTIPTENDREKSDVAHFAKFPPALVLPCILAGTSPYVCWNCETPLERVLGEPEITGESRSGNLERKSRAENGGLGAAEERRHQATSVPWEASTIPTIGWRATCKCHLAGRPMRAIATVLDPFSGTATTGHVAISQGRGYLGIEMNPAYARKGADRAVGPLFTEIALTDESAEPVNDEQGVLEL